MTEELKKELKKYHHFPKKTAKLKDVLALVRSGAYSNYDEGGDDLMNHIMYAKMGRITSIL